MRVNFYLVDKKKSNTAIYATVSYPSRWKYYLGLSVSPRQWDFAKQRVKYNHPNHIRLNRVLDTVQNKAIDLYLEAIEQDKALTRSNIKHHLDVILKKKEDTTNRLIPFIDQFIRQSGKKPNTVKAYKVVRQRLQDYKPDLTFDDITLDWFYGFVQHLKKSYKPNTVWATIKNLKVFLQDAYDRGLHSNEIFRHKKFSVNKQEVPNPYLNEQELETLYKKKFTARLQKAIDRFLVMCWTGLRISDINKVEIKNFEVLDGQECMRIETQKTGTTVLIPLHPMVMQILAKYDFRLPELSDQAQNMYIKEACQLAGIDKHVTNHTARRSFACNFYLAGVPEHTIMKIGGWMKYASFQTYVSKLLKSDHVKVASRMWQNKKGYLKAI